jgi:exodeoxyribonuclease VII small subunit
MTKKSKAEPAAVDTLSYEQAMEELERLVDSLNEGQMPLEELMTSYSRGAELLAHCQNRLQSVEQQIKVLEAGQLKAWESQA